MKIIFPVLVLALSAGQVSAQCPGGRCPVARVASIPANLAQRAVQTLRPVTATLVRPVAKVNVLRRAPVRNFVAGVLFWPHR